MSFLPIADGIEGFQDSFSLQRTRERIWFGERQYRLKRAKMHRLSLIGEYRTSTQFGDETPASFGFRHHSLRSGSSGSLIFRCISGLPGVRFGAFISTLFRPNPFSENPFLRGFYFTASPAASSRRMCRARSDKLYFVRAAFSGTSFCGTRILSARFRPSGRRPPIFGWAMTFIGAG